MNGLILLLRLNAYDISIGCMRRISVGAGNCLRLQRIFGSNLPDKRLCDKLSHYKFSVAGGTLYSPLPC